ncbi:hypothetical protein MANES_13G092290v8 [Manihot esculenta]|uniref:Uncharacterized protein n=1 Tax=Manihot esculenta TaxID=3983 RepID=A0ACB7GKW6_MANES|nr:hypothetical protein MANES_13G092290v8 [Manihot esculenta]
MEDYQQLKDKIERLIRDDTLCKFPRKNREKRRAEPEEPWTKQEVRFRPVDKAIRFFHNDPLVVNIHLNKYEVRRVLVDIGSSIDLLTLNIFNKLDLDKNNPVKVSYPLVGLGDRTVTVLGTINLPHVLGDEKQMRKLYAKFMVVDIPLTYNVILGRLVLNCHGIVINMHAMCLKLPAPRGLAVF